MSEGSTTPESLKSAREGRAQIRELLEGWSPACDECAAESRA
jgi:hypothetical protein